MLGRSSVLGRDFGMWSKAMWNRKFESLCCPESWAHIHWHTFGTGHTGTKSTSPTASHALNNSCPNSSQCCRETVGLFLLHFYLIYTGLSIFRNFLVRICGFLIILGTANMAGTSRHYFWLLIHCFRLTYCYIQTKTSHNENYARFYSSLYLKQVLHFRNQQSTFYYLFLTNQKYSYSKEFKFQFSLRFSEISG